MAGVLFMWKRFISNDRELLQAFITFFANAIEKLKIQSISKYKQAESNDLPRSNTDLLGKHIFKICNYCLEKGTLARAVKLEDYVIPGH